MDRVEVARTVSINATFTKLHQFLQHNPRGSFSTIVDPAIRSTIQRAAIGYTDLTKALVDQCFASAKTEIRYESVLDLKNVFTIDKYRINRLH